MKPARVRLHIDELMLEGFEPGDRHRIAAAVEVELGRLFADEGVPPGLASGRAMPRVDAGSFDALQGARPQEIGAQVARAVYRSFGASDAEQR
jgi:hypothetical protein